MIQQVVIFLIKILIGTTLGLIGVYNAKRYKKMRIFDNLTQDVKDDILEAAIAYAKADIEDNNLQVDVKVHAVGFGEMFQLCHPDFDTIDPMPISRWVGPRPVHRPKTW